MPAASRMMEQAGLVGKKAAQFSGVVRTELFAIAERQLKSGALQMIDENFEIVCVDVRMLRRPIEEILGMLHYVLIDRSARCNHHSERRGLPAACAPSSLP